MDIREVLNSIDKAELIERIIQYGDNGYYPLELFTMAAEKYSFSADELEEEWEGIVDHARRFDEDENPLAADVLSDGAGLVFEQAKRLNKEQAEGLLRRMIEDLTLATEEEGIGMQHDSEWLYIQVRDEIEEYLGE